METQSQEGRTPSTRRAPTHARLEIKSVEVHAAMAKRSENTSEELELIEMRFQHALALATLEEIISEGQLDSW
jgi:hypothetical protein